MTYKGWYAIKPNQPTTSSSTPNKSWACLSLCTHTRWNPSETSRQIHLPRKQCLINQKGHQHTANEGMDSYRLAIDHMEIRPDR